MSQEDKKPKPGRGAKLQSKKAEPPAPPVRLTVAQRQDQIRKLELLRQYMQNCHQALAEFQKFAAGFRAKKMKKIEVLVRKQEARDLRELEQGLDTV